MAITAKPYENFLVTLGVAYWDFLANTLKVALVTSGYTPDYAADTSYTVPATDELADDSSTDGGYTTGGSALLSKTWTVANGVATLNADPVGWSALTGTFRYAVVYRADVGNPLVGCIDFGADRTYNAEPFQLSFANGVLAITGA